MKDSNRKIVIMQWVVIAVLVIGGGIGAYLLINKTNQLETDQATQQGNLDSLQNQLKEAKTSPTPTTTPLPEASNNVGTPTPTPKATVTPTPKATVTPKSNGSNQ